MKVLLLEDDVKISGYLSKSLEAKGCVVTDVYDGLDALKKASSETFDIGIFDLMVPGLDGLSVLKKLRSADNLMPVIILSAKTSREDIIEGIQSGGDDYMVKPFHFEELMARIQGLLRRVNHQKETLLKCGDLSVDFIRQEVRREGQEITLQPMEYSLLSFLMRKKGQVVSKSTIIERVWDFNFDPQTNIVESRVCKLREKVDQPFSYPLIHTVRGFGYCLKSSNDE